MNNWYLKEIKETANFFDVDIEKGLPLEDVVARVRKFGANVDPYIKKEVQAVYRVRVKRQGRNEIIGLNSLVLGDIVRMEVGDRVPADVRLIWVKDLKIDQSKLTGEPLAATKNTFALKKESPLKEQKCMAFASSLVTEGCGIGIVVNLAEKSVQTSVYKPSKRKSDLIDSLVLRKLKKAKIVVQNTKKAKNIKDIDLILIDANLLDDEIKELITKVQLSKKISCKFIVNNKTALRLKQEFIGAIIYDGRDIAKHVPKQFINMVNDAQFITEASTQDIVKLLGGLSAHNYKTLFVSDGVRSPEALHASYISLIIGDYARGDCLATADLIAPKSKALILERILYNKI